jgi:SAM-dependent methyltransferase
MSERNPPTQYRDDRNLRARQRLWEQQRPPFDLIGWVLEVAGVTDGARVLDVGCGNGNYLAEMARRGVAAVGCDLSFGMLRSVAGPQVLVNADVTRLPLRDAAFDIVLAPHMLYHVDDVVAAAHELRRVTVPGGVCVAVTNGAAHMGALRELVEAAVRPVAPGWEMQSPATHVFSLDNGGAQLGAAFDSVTCVRPPDVSPVRVTEAGIVADYVASTADHYGPEVDRPWEEVVAEVRHAVQQVIDARGAFEVSGEVGALVCR